MVKRSFATGVVVFILLFAVLFAPPYASGADQSSKNVLLITSYHQGDRWNDSVVQGVREALESLESVNLSIECLDMRRYTGPDHIRMIKEYIRAKYQSKPQDLILVSDDPALTVLLNVREDLFPGVPVVFCGVNDFTQSRIHGQSNITGVNETLSLQATLDLALKLFPKTARIMGVVSDTEINGRVNLEHFRTVATQMKERVQFGELLNMTGKDAPDILSRLPKNSLVLRLTNLINTEGGYLSLQDSIRILSTHAPVPVFTPWSFDLGEGALGGYVSSGADQGRTAGNLAIRILQGQRAEQIPVVMESPNVPMFDYRVMERFGIKESALPQGSVVLNHHVSVWEQYWGWLLGFVVIAVLQTFLIVTLLTRGKRLRAANAALQDSEHFSRSLLEVIPVPVFYKGRDGRYQGFNQAFLHFYGKNKDELIGKSVFDITPLDMAKVYHAKDMELFEKSGIQVYPYKVKTAQNDLRDVIFHKASLTDEHGVVTGLIGAILDVTELKQIEIALQESERRFQNLHNASFGGIAIHEKGIILDCNQGLSNITGYSYEELIGMNGLLLIAEQSRELVMANISSGYEKPYEAYGLCKNGEVYPLRLEARNIPYQGREVRVVEFRDITESKRAEEENRRFKTIADNAGYGKAIADLKGNLLYVNRFFATSHGYEPEQLVGKHLSSLHSEEQMETVSHLLATMLGEGHFLPTTVWHRHRDGRDFPMLMSGIVIKDDYGKPQYLAASAIDITAQHQAEAKRAESESILRDILESTLSGFWDWDLVANTEYLSPTFKRMFGYEDHEMENSPESWQKIIFPEDLPGVLEVFDRHVKSRGVEPFYSEIRYLHRDGSTIWVICAGRVIEWTEDGAPIRMVGCHVDITERKRAEEDKKLLNAQLQQAQKLEAIGTLAGGIAHDFNNILGAIVGYSEMIRDDFPPGSPGIHDINQVLKASHRAKDLVKQILAFSRQVEDQKTPIQPAVIVKEAITLLRSSLPTTITIKQDIDAEAGIVLADPTQIHQIVMNLATNAFHAMEVKGGTLTISLQRRILTQEDLAKEPDLQPGAFVQLSIKDSGEGILPEIREKIFDPFFTTKEVGKGTGLGLSMAYSIVKGCRGSIACDSRVSEGAEFRILLPALEGHAEEENEVAALTPHGKEHILLIDDEEMLAELGQAMLERLGYHVTTRGNSLDALATFQNQPDAFDLIITDQTMPGMTGVDLARRILQIRPEMPIILCTGYSSQISEETAKVAGIKGFAFKPLAKKDIGVLIRKILDGKSS